MSTRRLATVGACFGLLVCVTVLTFLCLYGILQWRVGGKPGIDLTRLLWPSVVMLTEGWRHTLPGILITLSSVVINCMVYAAAFAGIGTAVARVRHLL